MDNFKKLFPLIFYINLDRRFDRRAQAEKEFSKVGIPATRISAISPNVNNDPRLSGVLGCTLSHRHCLELAYKEKCNVFIFEDDVKFVNDYKEIIEAACEEIANSDWDMLYLGANILKPFRQVFPHLARLTHGQSTHAYGVRADFVKTLLDGIPSNVVYPLDLLYTNFVIPKFNCYITAPKMVAVQRDSYSDIEGTQANYESYLEARYNSNFIPLP